jgi:hypothetical protein
MFFIEKKIKTFFLGLFDLLVHYGLINEKKISTHNYNKKSNYKTLKFYNIPFINYIKKIEEFFNFSYTEYNLLEFDDTYYIYTFHYSRMYEVCRKNFYSNKTFKFKQVAYFMNKINIKLYVDSEFQTNSKKYFPYSVSDLESELKITQIKFIEFFEKTG